MINQAASFETEHAGKGAKIPARNLIGEVPPRLRETPVDSTLPNKISCVAAHLFSVEHMEMPQPRDGRLAEPTQRQMDPTLLESLGQSAPPRTRRARAEQRNLAALTVQTGGGQHPLLKGLGEIEPLVCPDIRNWYRWKEKHRSAIDRLANPRPDRLTGKIRSEETEC